MKSDTIYTLSSYEEDGDIFIKLDQKLGNLLTFNGAACTLIKPSHLANTELKKKFKIKKNILHAILLCSLLAYTGFNRDTQKGENSKHSSLIS